MEVDKSSFFDKKEFINQCTICLNYANQLFTMDCNHFICKSCIFSKKWKDIIFCPICSNRINSHFTIKQKTKFQMHGVQKIIIDYHKIQDVDQYQPIIKFNDSSA